MKRRDDLLQEIEEYNRDTAHLLLQAYERKYHEHLGYQSFGDYVDERWPTRDRIRSSPGLRCFSWSDLFGRCSAE